MTKSDPHAYTRDEWRDLGFYYNRDDEKREWQLVGPRDGLSNFSRILIKYADNPRRELKSEHAHLGPYMYLKIMTWPEAGIGQKTIHGSLTDLRRLATIVRDTVAGMLAGETARIQEQFAPDSTYAIVLDARNDDTDPSSLDPVLPKIGG